MNCSSLPAYAEAQLRSTPIAVPVQKFEHAKGAAIPYGMAAPLFLQAMFSADGRLKRKHSLHWAKSLATIIRHTQSKTRPAWALPGLSACGAQHQIESKEDSL